MRAATKVIPVDLTNPGQFFACCGLLELASRLDYRSQGCFRDGQFHLKTTAEDVLMRFFACPVTVDTTFHGDSTEDDGDTEEEKTGDNDNPHRGRTYPMRLGEPFDLLLNWWTEKEAQSQKLKLWTAGQRVTDLLTGHYKTIKQKGSKGSQDKITKVYTPSTREHFAKVATDHPTDWLRKAVSIKAPGAFSFDSRLSRNNALDLGHFSGGMFAFSPATDVLSLVGLQRFRPEMIEVWTRNLYCVWSEYLPVAVAPVAAIGRIPSVVDLRFEFPIKARDSQGRYKLFGHAQPVRSSHV